MDLRVVQLRLRRVMLALSGLPGVGHLIAGSLAGKHTAIVAEPRRVRGSEPAWR